MKNIKFKFILLFFCLIISHITIGQQEKYKGVLIYRFTSYVQWPNLTNQSDFVIGTIGNSTLTPVLKEIAKTRKVKNKPITLKTWSSTNEIGNCNILFIPNSQRKNIDFILGKMTGKPTLIITESLGYAKKGSGINFVIRDNKVNFEINKGSISNAGLKLASGFEKLAIKVF